jgi:hypothetical protein
MTQFYRDPAHDVQRVHARLAQHKMAAVSSEKRLRA